MSDNCLFNKMETLTTHYETSSLFGHTRCVIIKKRVINAVVWCTYQYLLFIQT